MTHPSKSKSVTVTALSSSNSSKPESHLPELAATATSPEELQTYRDVEAAFYKSISELGSGHDCVIHEGVDGEGVPAWVLVIARGKPTSGQVKKAVHRVMDGMGRRK